MHVALVNWVKEPDVAPDSCRLDGAQVAGITASLTTPGASAGGAVQLAANKGRCFQGPIPVGAGFILNDETAEWLLGQPNVNYTDVVRRYLVSEDLADRPDQTPSRWIIDFAAMPLEDAMRYPAALDIVRALVKPERERNRDRGFREKWWRLGRSRGEMRVALQSLSRYAVAGRLGKRLNCEWQDVSVCPSDLVYVFAFEDDYSMGVLLSRAHGAWARVRGSSFKADPRYTPTSGFMTCSWPDPVRSAERDRVAAASVALLACRSEICLDRQIGLTTLYNRIDEGAYQDLRKLHVQLDEAVVGCYGWPKVVAQDDDELVRRLVELNVSIAAGTRVYQPFST